MTVNTGDQRKASAEDLPDGAGSDGEAPETGEDTASGGGADDE